MVHAVSSKISDLSLAIGKHASGDDKEKELKDDRCVPARVVRWTARILAVASVGLILAFLVGEGFDASRIQPGEWLGLVFFPVGICVGMILAWWREGLGGAITVGSLAAFYLIHLATAGAFPSGWAFLLFAVPGFLFLVSWQQSRRACTRA
jgi:hypothetical protein